MHRNAILFLLVFVTIGSIFKISTAAEPLLLLTLATEEASSLRRYLKCTAANGLLTKVNVLGETENSIIRTKLEEVLVNNEDPIVLYTSTYDSLFLGTEAEIVTQFIRANVGILFSGGRKRVNNCTLEKFLDSGAFIGRGSAVLKLFKSKLVIGPNGTAQDVLDNLKAQFDFNIGVDTRSKIFQNVLEGAGIGSCSSLSGPNSHYWADLKTIPTTASWGELELQSRCDFPVLANTRTQTRPLVLLGDTNPVSRSLLSNFGDYLCGEWDSKYGCSDCLNNVRTLSSTQELPTVLLGIFLARPMPFLQRFFVHILSLEYPRDRLHLVLYNGNARNEAGAQEFLSGNNISYASVFVLDRSLKPWEARNLALKRAIEQEHDYYFSVDGEARLDRSTVLRELIEQNRVVVSPLLVQPYWRSSNYWGAINEKGRPIRALNYESVVNWEHRGLWTVPCVNKAYLVNITGLKASPQLNFVYNRNNSEMFCCVGPNDSVPYGNMRVTGTLKHLLLLSSYKGQEIGRAWPFHMSNRHKFGHIVTPSLQRYPDDIYQVTRNRYDWELSYLDPKWSSALEPTVPVAQPCRDVYWFPAFSPLFCSEIIRRMEAHGNWTLGTNFVPSAAGQAHPNPDPYPTVDIELTEIGLDLAWLDIVRAYVLPVRARVFSGEVVDPPEIHTTFVIRYRPEEQSANQPHHDASTYTLNLALNEGFEGGGCRFLSHNCSVVRTRVGWILMHPGELTHYHEGLSVTRGTRYIMVSFLDPKDHQ